MTKFEEQLIDKGYLTHTFNCSTNKYERGRKAISTMVNLDNRYINKDTKPICMFNAISTNKNKQSICVCRFC